jgi:O-antigen/teichoic acid export membrane protein
LRGCRLVNGERDNVSCFRSRVASLRGVLEEDATLRRVLKNTGWLTGSSGVTTLLSVIQSALTARLLGVAVWGVLAIAISFAAVVGRLLSFRMNDFVVKWITQLAEEGGGSAPTAFKLALVADACTWFLAFLLVEAFAAWGAATFAKNADLIWVFRLIGLTVLLQAGQESLVGILHVNRDFRIQSIVAVFCQAASVCGIAWVFWARGGLHEVVVVLVCAQALASISMWVFGLRAANTVLPTGWVRSPLARLGSLGREMLRFAVLVNFGATVKATMGGDGDLLVLGFLASPAQVAYYKLAKSICQIAQMPMMPMVYASYPEFSTAVAREEWTGFRRLMRRGSKVGAFWVIPVSIGLVALAPFAIGLLYGPTFLPAVPALALLLVGFCFDGVLYWTHVALLSTGQPGFDTGVILGMAAVKLGLAFLIVPSGGYVAMAAISSVVLTAQNLVAARRVHVTIRARESAAA